MSEENITGKDLLRHVKWKSDYLNWLIADLKKISELNKHTSLIISRGSGNILSKLVEVKETVEKKIEHLEKLTSNQLLTNEELANGIVSMEVELRERGGRNAIDG